MSERVILHSDMNCFYASVEMLHHPEFAGMPLAVGGDPEARHGIVLTANYIAKQKGVKTGMALWEDGRKYSIDRILKIERCASRKAGGVGMMYTCMIQGQESHLFYEVDKWFMERKTA